MTRPAPLWTFAFVLSASILLYGCTSGGPSPSASPFATLLSISLNESGGISGSFFKSWTLTNTTLFVTQQGQTGSTTLSEEQISGLKQYLSESGFFSKPLAETNRCADCYAYAGFVSVDGQRRDIQLGGNDVASDALTGLVGRLNQLSPTFESAASNAECQVDSDCVTAGCSGTLCLPKNAPTRVTTCEYEPQYACYRADGCLCQAGKCAWSQSTIQCLQDFNKPTGQTDAERACQESCLRQVSAGRELSSGPCLSNAITQGWVCDVAHRPRNDAVDNDPANTCPAYGSTAKHFVEVDENCRIIQAA